MNVADELRMLAAQLPYSNMSSEEIQGKLNNIANRLGNKVYSGKWVTKESNVIHYATNEVILVAKNKCEAKSLCELHNVYFCEN